VAMAAGGGVLAFAGWIAHSDSATFTVQASEVAQVPRPTVTMTLVPIVTWKRVRLTSNTPVQRYVVTRHTGTTARIVCTLSASLPPVCIDPTAPLGGPITYTVYATHGEHWVGVDSAPSLPVGTPADPLAVGPSDQPVPPSVGPSAAAVPVPSDPPADLDNPMTASTATVSPTTPTGFLPPASLAPTTDAPSTGPSFTGDATHHRAPGQPADGSVISSDGAGRCRGPAGCRQGSDVR
jgi:hypothetical protein